MSRPHIGQPYLRSASRMWLPNRRCASQHAIRRNATTLRHTAGYVSPMRCGGGREIPASGPCDGIGALELSAPHGSVPRNRLGRERRRNGAHSRVSQNRQNLQISTPPTSHLGGRGHLAPSQGGDRSAAPIARLRQQRAYVLAIAPAGCSPWRKSTARCAWPAAENIARLSSWSIRSQ